MRNLDKYAAALCKQFSRSDPCVLSADNDCDYVSCWASATTLTSFKCVYDAACKPMKRSAAPAGPQGTE